MERPWKVYYSIKKQRSITGRPFIDFEAEAPDGTIISTDIEGKKLQAKLEELFNDSK